MILETVILTEENRFDIARRTGRDPEDLWRMWRDAHRDSKVVVFKLRQENT